MRKKEQKKWLIVGVVLFLGLLALEAQAQVTEKHCARLYRAKQFQRAAQCFQRLAQQLGQKRKFYRGRLLRNAALLHEKAARASEGKQVRYHQEQALILLELYLREQLCETPERCRQVVVIRNRVQRALGYARLSIRVEPSFAHILLWRDNFYRRGKGRWSGKVAPGEYQLRVKAKGRKTLQRKIRIRAHKERSLSLKLSSLAATGRPVVRRRRPFLRRAKGGQGGSLPALAWVGYLGGGALVVAGGVLLGVGFHQRGDVVRRIEDPKVPDFPDGGRQELTQAEALAWSGGISAGVGLALVVTGLVFHLTRPTPPSAQADGAQGLRSPLTFRPPLPPSTSSRRSSFPSSAALP